jgi:hypothetical protein
VLQEYAVIYAKEHGAEETVAELCPHMLQAFLDGDREFQRARKTGSKFGDQKS